MAAESELFLHLQFLHVMNYIPVLFALRRFNHQKNTKTQYWIEVFVFKLPPGGTLQVEQGDGWKGFEQAK